MYIYIYMCVYAVGAISWPYFGHFRVNNLATSRSITWPPFLTYKSSVFLVFSMHSFQGVVQN